MDESKPMRERPRLLQSFPPELLKYIDNKLDEARRMYPTQSDHVLLVYSWAKSLEAKWEANEK